MRCVRHPGDMLQPASDPCQIYTASIIMRYKRPLCDTKEVAGEPLIKCQTAPEGPSSSLTPWERDAVHSASGESTSPHRRLLHHLLHDHHLLHGHHLPTVDVVLVAVLVVVVLVVALVVAVLVVALVAGYSSSSSWTPDPLRCANRATNTPVPEQEHPSIDTTPGRLPSVSEREQHLWCICVGGWNAGGVRKR